MTLKEIQIILMQEAALSECRRRHFSAAIIGSHLSGYYIISKGHNQSPFGKCKKCYRASEEIGQGYHTCPALHAEEMAILNGLREMSVLSDYSLMAYGEDVKTEERIVAVNPCKHCVSLIKEVKLKEVIELNDDGSISKWDGHTWYMAGAGRPPKIK
jgi:deoxycytidylate deaminase